MRLTAADGTYFYYAHLDAFAPGIASGVPVRAGQLIGFNGATAFRLYRRLVLPGLSARHAAIPVAVLPSTSPAMAAMGLAAKAEAWRGVLRPLDG